MPKYVCERGIGGLMEHSEVLERGNVAAHFFVRVCTPMVIISSVALPQTPIYAPSTPNCETFFYELLL